MTAVPSNEVRADLPEAEHNPYADESSNRNREIPLGPGEVRWTNVCSTTAAVLVLIVGIGLAWTVVTWQRLNEMLVARAWISASASEMFVMAGCSAVGIGLSALAYHHVHQNMSAAFRRIAAAEIRTRQFAEAALKLKADVLARKQGGTSSTADSLSNNPSRPT
ncbi:MAG: hypothetical protein R3C49_01590 [Planctomycetaceae bacterium]